MGSYCGADGVDDWDEAKWSEEISENQVGRFRLIYFLFFLAVQDSSISDIVGLSVGRSEPTNNQSLGSIKE